MTRGLCFVHENVFYTNDTSMSHVLVLRLLRYAVTVANVCACELLCRSVVVSTPTEVSPVGDKSVEHYTVVV